MKRRVVFEDVNRIIVQFGGRALKYDDKLKNTLLPRAEALSMMQFLDKKYPGLSNLISGDSALMKEVPSVSEMPMRTLVALCRQTTLFIPEGMDNGLV